MLIVGYKAPIDWSKVKAALVRHTSMPSAKVEQIIKNIKNGQTVQLDIDIALEDDLKDIGIRIK